MENTKYDDKFYRLPKRLFKEEQFRSMTNEEKSHNLIYRSHQGLGKPKKISAVFRLYESYCKKMMQHDIIGLTKET
ncbi:MAG: hypothetical protein MR589_10095 [Lachnobacterium sp.]|nr:hypothetical protein [Lachnobacterium sp.]